MEHAPDLVRALYYGDNLSLLRAYLADETIDLIYLDPPFYSQRNYHAFFKRSLAATTGQTRVPAFGDTWRWDSACESSYPEVLASIPACVARALTALSTLLGRGPLFAYLVMMADRLVELHRVLKPTGSMYLHCDPAASHYLKILLDAVFGAANFRNEIVWFYKTGGASHRHFSRKHDLIFFYTKSEHYIFHALKEKSYMMHRYGFKKSEFLQDTHGNYTWVYMKDVWQLPAVGAADRQRLGYPTQKPEALLERIIRASSDDGALVLDPFCGSGTTLTVAQRLGRGWIGMENHCLGIAYQRFRLAQAFPTLQYLFAGGPSTFEEARLLAHLDAVQFRWWVLSLLCARPVGEEDRTYATGIAHGILPVSAGGAGPCLVLVALERLARETIQRLYELLQHGKAARILIITLALTSVQVIHADFRDVMGMASSLLACVEVKPLAELLTQPDLSAPSSSASWEKTG